MIISVTRRDFVSWSEGHRLWSNRMNEEIPELVSTVIPVFNRPSMLREAVQTVLNQTYRPIEILIADDASTDDTPQVGMELQSR